MPNRIIRESARASPTLDVLSAEAECLFYRLIVTVDDHGRFHADPVLVLAACLPLRVERLKATRVERWLNELANAGAIRLYVVGGRKYLCFPTWRRYQRRPQSLSKFPNPSSEHGATTVTPPRLHHDGSVNAPPLREVVNRESRVTVPTPSTESPVAYRQRLFRTLKDLSSDEARAFVNALSEGLGDRCGWSHAQFREHMMRYLAARATANVNCPDTQPRP